MGDGYNFTKLKEHILCLSDSNDWETAKKEWKLIDVQKSDTPETCLCGHHPITEICTIYNPITKRTADIGNVCVKKFLGFRSDLIFTALKRIRKDNSKSLNSDAIIFFKEKNILTDWEYKFLSDTQRKKKLTNKQLQKRQKINTKILQIVDKRRTRTQ